MKEHRFWFLLSRWQLFDNDSRWHLCQQIKTTLQRCKIFSLWMVTWIIYRRREACLVFFPSFFLLRHAYFILWYNKVFVTKSVRKLNLRWKCAQIMAENSLLFFCLNFFSVSHLINVVLFIYSWKMSSEMLLKNSRRPFFVVNFVTFHVRIIYYLTKHCS